MPEFTPVKVQQPFQQNNSKKGSNKLPLKKSLSSMHSNNNKLQEEDENTSQDNA